mmetsp:Transcript_14478/g.41707  ORF Transcript_14478/g.41707 Transcript_14478/m.41707 type:complete len:296 (-) Transcript_14478:139-1026(-)
MLSRGMPRCTRAANGDTRPLVTLHISFGWLLMPTESPVSPASTSTPRRVDANGSAWPPWMLVVLLAAWSSSVSACACASGVRRGSVGPYHKAAREWGSGNSLSGTPASRSCSALYMMARWRRARTLAATNQADLRTLRQRMGWGAASYCDSSKNDATSRLLNLTRVGCTCASSICCNTSHASSLRCFLDMMHPCSARVNETSSMGSPDPTSASSPSSKASHLLRCRLLHILRWKSLRRRVTSANSEALGGAGIGTADASGEEEAASWSLLLLCGFARSCLTAARPCDTGREAAAF